MTDIDLEKELEKRSYAKRELRLSSNSISDFFSKNLGAPDIGRDLTFFEHEKWTEKNHEVTYNAWQVNDYYNIKFFVNQNQYGTGNYKRWERDGYVLFFGAGIMYNHTI